jgi:chromosomal replication initiation ATPase DnaA
MVLYRLDKAVVEELRKEAEDQINPILSKYNVTWEQVFKHNRSTLFILARQEICVAIRTKLKWSYPKIGRLFNRDHATILNSVNKYKQLRK